MKFTKTVQLTILHGVLQSYIRVCSLSQTIPVLLWSTTTTVLSLESLLTHRQDSFKGMHMGLGLVSLNIMSLKKLGMYAMAQSINMFRTMVAAFTYSHNKPFKVCSLLQTILVLMWSIYHHDGSVFGISADLWTKFFQGHAHGPGAGKP